MRDYRTPKGWVLIGTSDMSFGRDETKAQKRQKELRARRALRNTSTWKPKTWDGEVWTVSEELFDEGMKEAEKKIARKASYEKAKHEGKLWTKKEKAASREKKRIMRREARLAKKVVLV